MEPIGFIGYWVEQKSWWRYFTEIIADANWKKKLQRLRLIPEKRIIKLILFNYHVFVIYEVKWTINKMWCKTNKIRVNGVGPERVKAILLC